MLNLGAFMPAAFAEQSFLVDRQQQNFSMCTLITARMMLQLLLFKWCL